MPLSEHEQRLLDEMERSLYENEADVVRPAARGRVNVRRVVLGVCAIVIGLVGLVVGVASQLLVVGVTAFVAMFVGSWLAVTPGRRATPDDSAHAARSSGSGRPGQPGTSRGGFADRMSERWERREDRDGS